MAPRWPRLVPLLACLYLPFISGGLLTDDFAHVDHLTRIDSAARIVDSPDTFGFYRPVTQASIALSPGANGRRPAQARALNVVLHALVIALAFLVARLVLESSLAAGLAALAFALTPKAHPIAALWISARAELLMALFSFAGVAAWIVWTRRGRPLWLAAAGLAYALALLSKETVTLLPFLLLITPRSERSLTSRAMAVTALLALAAVIYTWRAQTGALTPFSGDEHYSLMVPLMLWARNGMNYAGRMLVAPLALVAVVGIAALVARNPGLQAGLKTRLYVRSEAPLVAVATFSLVWVLAFLAPVLPVVLRSELYLYLPVFGLCLLAGWMAAALVQRVDGRRAVAVAIGAYVLAFAGYQIARANAIHQDLVFSEKLIAAMQSSPELARSDGRVLLLPSDAATERFFQDAVGAYFYVVLQQALHRTRLTGDVQYRGNRARQADLRLTCGYRQDEGVVIISPAP